MYKHILYATDLTEDTEFLVKKVKEIRTYAGAKLSLVHVLELLPGYSYAYLGVEDIQGQLIQEARLAMEKLSMELNVDKGDLHIEVGPTKTKILKVAKDNNVDLIICGSHGRHGLSLLLGSTANAILHGATCDVLTVRLPENI